MKLQNYKSTLDTICCIVVQVSCNWDSGQHLHNIRNNWNHNYIKPTSLLYLVNITNGKMEPKSYLTCNQSWFADWIITKVKDIYKDRFALARGSATQDMSKRDSMTSHARRACLDVFPDRVRQLKIDLDGTFKQTHELGQFAVSFCLHWFVCTSEHLVLKQCLLKQKNNHSPTAINKFKIKSKSRWNIIHKIKSNNIRPVDMILSFLCVPNYYRSMTIGVSSSTLYPSLLYLFDW